jgi:hypothetical protein
VKGKLVLLVVSLGLALAAGETALHWARPGWAIFYPPICFRPDLYEPVAAYGYRIFPSRTVPHRYPVEQPRTITLTSNADGFRSRRELHDTDARRRIVVVGDSMVFGEGVEEPERFTERLERLEPGWRVDNLGMIGYGPDLMLRALEAVGLDPVPDAVLFAVFTDDLRRVVLPYSGAGFPIPRFRLEAGRLESVPYPVLPAWERLRLVQGLLYLYWRYTPATFALNAAILDRFLERAHHDRFAPAILFLPGPQDRADDRRRRAWLAAYAAQTGTPFLDLTDAVRAAGIARSYIPNDPHWSPEGHAVVAEALRPFVAERVLGR